MILDDFFTAAADFNEEALARILHPEAQISEMPNLINRGGTERDLTDARCGSGGDSRSPASNAPGRSFARTGSRLR